MTHTISTRLIAAALAGLLPVAAAAQDGTGGLRLTFDLSQRFQATTDDDLTDTDITPQQSATTSISGAFASETRTENLAFNLNTGLRVTNGDTEVSDPSLALSYGRIGPTSGLDLTANWSQSSFETLRNLAAFTDEDGTVVLPEDQDDLTGAGTRTSRSAGVALRWGENQPLGASLGVNLSDLRYDGVTSANVTDSRSASVTAGLQLALSPVSRANITLRYRRTDDGDLTDSTLLTARLTQDRPLGALTATLTAQRNADEAARLGFTLGRRYALPEAAVNASIGVAQDANGDPALTGRLSWQRALPTGQISLNFAQAVAAGVDGDTDTTTLSGNYSRALSPRGTLQMGFDFARTSDADDTVTTRNLNASYGYSLTPDWQINVGASHNLRDTDATGRTDAQSVFMTLNRSLSVRP